MADYTLDDLYKELDTLTDEDSFTTLPEINEVVTIRDKAVLLNIEGYGEKWVPKSVLRVDTDETVYVKEWFYKKEL